MAENRHETNKFRFFFVGATNNFCWTSCWYIASRCLISFFVAFYLLPIFWQEKIQEVDFVAVFSCKNFQGILQKNIYFFPNGLCKGPKVARCIFTYFFPTKRKLTHFTQNAKLYPLFAYAPTFILSVFSFLKIIGFVRASGKKFRHRAAVKGAN